MTANEAIKILEVAKAECEWNAPLDYQEAFDLAISALREQDLQPSCNQLATDYISRQAAIDALEKWESESTWDEWCYDHKDEAKKYSVISPSSVVSGLPSAEPERKVGKWEQESESLWKDRRSRWKCSACGKHVLIGVYDDPIEAGLMFCPNCGARMEETE